MADIRCAGCDQPAVVGMMSYGPDGGTTDLCPDHLAEWALAYAMEAYPQLREAADRGAETAVTAEDGPAGPTDQGGRKRRRRRSPQAAEEPESQAAGVAEVEGTEHDGGDSSVELGADPAGAGRRHWGGVEPAPAD